MKSSKFKQKKFNNKLWQCLGAGKFKTEWEFKTAKQSSRITSIFVSYFHSPRIIRWHGFRERPGRKPGHVNLTLYFHFILSPFSSNIIIPIEMWSQWEILIRYGGMNHYIIHRTEQAEIWTWDLLQAGAERAIRSLSKNHYRAHQSTCRASPRAMSAC